MSTKCAERVASRESGVAGEWVARCALRVAGFGIRVTSCAAGGLGMASHRELGADINFKEWTLE